MKALILSSVCFLVMVNGLRAQDPPKDLGRAISQSPELMKLVERKPWWRAVQDAYRPWLILAVGAGVVAIFRRLNRRIQLVTWIVVLAFMVLVCFVVWGFVVWGFADGVSWSWSISRLWPLGALLVLGTSGGLAILRRRRKLFIRASKHEEAWDVEEVRQEEPAN